MNKLERLNIDRKKLMNTSELVNLRGGENDQGTCAFQFPDGNVECYLTKQDALDYMTFYKGQAGIAWCCDSCSSAPWWISHCSPNPS